MESVKTFVFKGETFALDIKDVTVAKFILLEKEKQRLAGSKYFDMATTYFENTLQAINIIDMIATFRVLLPDMEKCLGTGLSYETMNLLDVRELLILFRKEVNPWFQEWMKEFNSPFEEKESER